MKSNKGFTLVELLTVIVILAAIALIAVPKVLNVINDSKEKSNMNSVYGLVEAGRLYSTTHDDLVYDHNGHSDITEFLKISGSKPDEYNVVVNSDGEIKIKVVFGEITYFKDFGSKNISKLGGSSSGGIDTGLINPGSTITGEPDPGETTPGETTPEEQFDNSMRDKLIEDNTEATFVKFGSDYRFVGPNVNNYVSFSGSKWRIIGFIDGKIKIIRLDSIGTYSWDTNGENNWVTSSLNEHLNGTFYNGLSDKDMVESVTYKLGGIANTKVEMEEILATEHGTEVYGNKPTEITDTKVAVMYMSDYAYSMKKGDGGCNEVAYDFDNSSCKGNASWLYNSGKDEVLLNPRSDGNNVCFINFSGYIGYGPATLGGATRPTLFLKSNVAITGGTGTKSKPYQLSLS